jgi:hypothetical protein
MARVEIHFEDDNGSTLTVSQRSLSPVAELGLDAAQVAQDAFRKFLTACGLTVSAAAAEPSSVDTPGETAGDPPAEEASTKDAKAKEKAS